LKVKVNVLLPSVAFTLKQKQISEYNHKFSNAFVSVLPNAKVIKTFVNLKYFTSISDKLFIKFAFLGKKMISNKESKHIHTSFCQYLCDSKS